MQLPSIRVSPIEFNSLTVETISFINFYVCQALSLVGPQTIEEMKTLAVEMFSDIQYNGEVLDSARYMHMCIVYV
jgi:hypothetical protein